MRIRAKEDISLLELIMETFPETSLTKAKKMIIYGSISYRNAIVKSTELIIPKGDEIVYTKYRGGKRVVREKTDVPVLFEDRDIIFVLKSPGINLDSKPNERHKSLFSLTKSYVRRKWHSRQDLFIVHEMSQEEGGVCMFAKSIEARNYLRENIENIRLEADILIGGKPRHKNDRISIWVDAGPRNRFEVVDGELDGSILSSIKYTTIHNYDTFTHIRAEIEPNSSYKTRFHLSHVGNPIIGDNLYGERQASPNWLKLYITAIELIHPITRKKIKIETALPNSFTKVNLPI